MAITINGTSAGETLTATTAEEYIIFGRGGADFITGGILNDMIYGGFGNDTLDGNDGDDDFFVGIREGVDSYTGGNGNDRILALADNVVIGISALSGIEAISANGFANVTIVGSNNGDTLDFSNVILTGIASINGGGGNDTLILTSTADTINGGAGTDIVNALGGDDRILVGFNGGYDIIDGGSGYDIVEAAAENVVMFLGSVTGIEEISAGAFGNIKVQFSAANDIINLTSITLTGLLDFNSGLGDDTIIGGAADETLSGGNGDDIIRGNGGSDFIDGGAGLDTLEGGAGDDTFFVGAGGAGRDIIRGGTGFDTILAKIDNAKVIFDGTNITGIEFISSQGFANFTIEAAATGASFNLTGILFDEGDIAAINGSFFDDNITGSRVSDILNGNSGNDRLFGGTGDDTVSGNDGDDFVDGGVGSDTLSGGEGNDTLLGQFGADALDGGNGNDTLTGGNSDDFVDGGEGDDIFLFAQNAGIDTVVGGNGFDTIRGASNGAAIVWTQVSGIEAADSGGFSNVTISGTISDDTLDLTGVAVTGIRNINGLGGNDTVIGSDSNDTVQGGNGNDTVNGGNGDDVVQGGIGLDFLTGGAGNDIFRDLGKDLNGDTITDFAIGDRISVSNFAFNAAGSAVLTGNTLRIDPDGVGGFAAINVTLQGAYNNNFALSADPLGGLAIVYNG